MKTIFILSGLLLSGVFFGQSAKRISELESKFKKSYYFKLFPESDIKTIVSNYICLEKNYKINPETEKEFLTEQNFYDRYPGYLIDENFTIENASILEEAKKEMHFNPQTRKNDIFPKCLKDKTK